MKNKIFTIALTFMGSSFLFAQQWTGANNTTSDISRGGKVSIGITTATEDLNIFNSIGIYADNGNTARSQFSTIKMYSRMVVMIL